MTERRLFGLLLLGLTLLAYAGAGTLEFVNYDDPGYIARNPVVQRGLTWEGVTYAFTSTRLGNWHPLTWLSHMGAVEFLGAAPGAHHWVNVALHALNTLLLFALLGTATGAQRRSAAVAALFAVHPLHVESVAWIAERKDVLSTSCWLLATLCWVRWTRARHAGWYVGAMVATILGFASKSMLVTLPFTWLLLDVWPLGRISPRTLGSRLLEKLPFFALAAGFSLLAFFVQAQEGAVGALEQFSLAQRGANALGSIATYLGQTLWPSDLAVYYPYPAKTGSAEIVRAVLGGVFVVGILVAGYRSLERRPWIAVGSCWFLGTLVPVLGLVQIGSQAHADRYTYVPHIGLFTLLVWASAEVLGTWPRRVLCTAALGACCALTWTQVRVWRNTETLFAHAIEATDFNPVARHFLGLEMALQGRAAEAEQHYAAAIEGGTPFVQSYVGLGNLLTEKGDLPGAEAVLREATQLAPRQAEGWAALGAVLGRGNRPREAVQALNRALELAPGMNDARFNLVTAYLASGEQSAALGELQALLARRPRSITRKPETLTLAGRVIADPASPAGDLEIAQAIAQAFAKAGNKDAVQLVQRAASRLGRDAPK